MPRMTPERLRRTAEVCTPEEVEEEIARIEHTCHRNGGVGCWRCEIDETREEATPE